MKRYSFFRESILCLYALLGLMSLSAAVPGEIQGIVVDADSGEPVIGCIVRSKGAFTSTDKDGRFVITPGEDADSVAFRFMGYEPCSLPLSSDLSHVSLYRKATQLHDVIVEAPDIYARGDTLVFNVSRYSDARDDAIIDVIKRLPGIKVEEDGTIKYQGKPINKFYIDGNDFIGGQYGLATNNISHRDVASVEVMENHQPVKALEGIEFPEEAGINLKLKDDARSRWVGVAGAAVGIQPLLYDGSLYTMRIAPKLQNIITLKADNTGWNPANEIQEHDFDDLFSTDYASKLWPEYISADMFNSPLSEKRTRINRSLLADAIAAWKSGDSSMRMKLDYMGDRLDFRSGVTTDYLSPLIPQFVQDNSQRLRTRDVSAQFFCQTNRPGYYLKEKLSLMGSRSSSISAVSGSADLTQLVDRKGISVCNDLKLVKRNEKNLFTLISRNTFGYIPVRLLVNGDEEEMQRIATTDFRSTTETKIGKMYRFWKYYVTAGLDINCHWMNCSLSGLGEFDNAGIHFAFLSNLYATPQIDYERYGWRASLSVPIKWLHYSVGGRYDFFNTCPLLSVRRLLTAKSEISASLGYNIETPQPYHFISVPILTDYHNLFIAGNPENYSQELAVSFSYRYRNPLKSLFLNVSASYNSSRSLMMSDQLFLDDFIISTYAYRPHHNDIWSLSAGGSKGIGHGRMVLGFELVGSFSSASQMRDNAEIPSRQLSAGVNPYFKGSLLKWLSVNYEANYQFSKLVINNVSNYCHTFHQNVFATIIPEDHIHFTLAAEHYLTHFPEGDLSSLVLFDASAVWQLTGKVRLSLTASNLLNQRDYRYITYGTLSQSQRFFQIRARTILASIQYRF